MSFFGQHLIFFRVLMSITNLVNAYFVNLQFSFSTPEFSTTWHCLEAGIMAECTISPLAFTMTMEGIIIRASRWVVQKLVPLHFE